VPRKLGHAVKAADELIATPITTAAAWRWFRCPRPRATFTLMPAGTARVALRQIAPKPDSVDRVTRLSTRRFLKATGDAEIAWLFRRRRHRARH